jgi:hypothetical protein
VLLLLCFYGARVADEAKYPCRVGQIGVSKWANPALFGSFDAIGIKQVG